MSGARRASRSPYAVGDRARVLYGAAGLGTVLRVCTVAAVAPLGDGRWRVSFAGVERPHVVGADGRDAHGYVQPVKNRVVSGLTFLEGDGGMST